jgi:gliding motility-associated-like protein
MGFGRKIFAFISVVGFGLMAIPLKSQLKFVENTGQWPSAYHFKASLNSADIWISDSGIWINNWDPNASEKMHERSAEEFVVNGHALLLKFKNGNFRKSYGKGDAFVERYNFFYGNSLKQRTAAKAYPAVTVKDLYPGVDLEIMEYQGRIKYNIICSDPEQVKQIRWKYDGASGTKVQTDNLEIQTNLGVFAEQLPRVYSIHKSAETDLQAEYLVDAGFIGVNIKSESVKRRKTKTIIDPVLVFSTFSGSRADNFGCSGTYDEQGNAYAGGTVFNAGLPTTPGAYQIRFGGGQSESLGYGGARDAAILKFSPNGSTLLYCTYLGGENNEQPHSMVADRFGNLYIMGSTKSRTFPVTAGAYQSTLGGDYDFFVSKISSDGSKLLASTFVGGAGMDAVGANRATDPINDYPLLYNYADEFRGEIITDDTQVFIAGFTYSIDFPKSSNSASFGGKEDAVIFAMNNNLTQLKWSQLAGSSGYDAFYGVALGKHGDLYASGGSSSQDLPSKFPGIFKKNYQGGIADGIAFRFDKNTGKAMAATHVGTALYEQAYFAQTDNSGSPYFFGQTEGVFPIVNAIYNQPAKGQFIVRYDTGLNNVTLSTTFGANSNQPNISPSAFLVDRCERIFVSGWGGSTNDYLTDNQTGSPKIHRNTGNTRNLPITSDAAQKVTDGSDFYVAVFSKNMNGLAYATYFGGISAAGKDAEEHVDGGTSRFDKKGIIYQSVCAGCGRNGLFPTTPGAYSRTMNSNNCNNAIFKIDFENLNKKPFMKDTFVQVIATQPIQFSLKATDPDPFDTLMLRAFRVKNGGMNGSDTAKITVTPGIGSAGISVSWNTGCNSFSADTVVYRIMVFDRGCPKADTVWANIRILVTPPPKVVPPDAICVSLDRTTGRIKVSWKATTQPAAFFKYILLERTNPDNSVVIMDTVKNYNAGEYTDLTAVDPSNNNYCYRLKGYNICNELVESVYPFCTVSELNSPIASTPMKFATVDFDKTVRSEWEPSKEPDFKEYEIYRYPRGGSKGKSPFVITTDTFINDSSFNVDNESYCYTVVVVDKCGHVSKPGGEACNIVLTGTATGRPLYYFDLNWQDYLSWNGAVDYWTVERQYASNPWSAIASNVKNKEARDANLDYDWGGYWYRVTAHEFAATANKKPYTSQSNWIYLYQPPELWVPNAFTENEDRINDVWGTVPVFVKNYHMRVYDRWGGKIWESSDKKQQWDGKINGKTAPDGVYAWYVIFDGWDNKTYKTKGTVTVIH